MGARKHEQSGGRDTGSSLAIEQPAGIDVDEVIVRRTSLRDWAPPGGLAKTFCGICGSHLFGRDPVSAEISIVRVAAIDGDPGVRPAAHQFVAYAAAWEDIRNDGLPRFDERLPGQ